LIHVLTQKGKGVRFAERDALCCHGVSSFDKVPGDRRLKNKTPSYTDVFSKTLVEIARNNPRVVAITAAMADGTGLNRFADALPDRFFDVGIAEQHAVTFAGGLASEGLIPVVAVYSTFLQRAYDQVIHDIALQKLPVRFAIDRAGLVGEDGPTHHGAFDMSYLSQVPNLVLMSPKDENELRHMVNTLIAYGEGPIVVRFPRSSGLGVPMDSELRTLPIGKGEVITGGKDVVFCAIGSGVAASVKAARLLEKKGIGAAVLNARFAKPIDTNLVEEMLGSEPAVVTVEENALIGGFGSSILHHLAVSGYDTSRIRNVGIPDRFVEHASREELLAEIGLSAESLAQVALEMIGAQRRFYKPLAG
jgi:1-deoxy-D-xylulose-5-phosphate synthase